MPKTRVSETIARPARTGIQMVPAGVVTELIDVFIYDVDDRGYAALFAGLTLLFSWIQTGLENAKGQGWWLRSVPPGEVPAAGD